MDREIPIKPVFDHSAHPNISRMPLWVRQSLAGGEYAATAQAVHSGQLHTVCESARCPNKGECWSRGTATFMLLGDTCTRACGFCAVDTGRPDDVDQDEPRRVADAVARLGLDYVVLTSVNRDDLIDGGAGIFAETLEAILSRRPGTGVEVLTPDFRNCQEAAVERISRSLGGDDRLIFGHNVETVPDLYKPVRRGARYERSLSLLERARQWARIETKSSIMLGLGEREDEVVQVMKDLRSVGVSRIAIGQYLRPSRYHLPVKAYVTPEQFEQYGEQAKALGFSWVKSGPMVRSSYHAEE